MKTTKNASNKANTKPAKATKGTAKSGAKKLSQIGAANQVRAKASEPMNCKAMVEALAKQGLRSSPGGKTPHATRFVQRFCARAK